MTRLALLVHRRAARILVVAGLFFVVAGAVGGPVAGKLHARDRDFQDPRAENVVAADRIIAATGAEADAGLVALAPRARARDVIRPLSADPDVARVVRPRDNPAALVSRDGRLVAVPAILRHGEAKQTADRLRPRLHAEGARVGGHAVAFNQLGDQVSHDLARAELIAFPILFLLSLWVFRGVVAALLPPLTGALSIVTTFLALRFVDAEVNPLSVFAVNLVTGLGLGLAIDYSLFVVSRYREEVARGGPGPEALVRTLRSAGRTVLFSSLTVAVAAASLTVFPLRFLYSMGIGGAIVALAGATVALTVLPALLVVLGGRVNSLAPRWLQRAREAATRPAESGGWYRFAHGVMRRPGLVAVLAGGALLAAGTPFLRVTFVPASEKMLPVRAEARQVAETLASRFAGNGSQPAQVVLSAPAGAARRVDAYARRLAALPGAPQVAAPRWLGRGTWEVDVLLRGDPTTPANQSLVRAVRAAPAPFRSAVTGTTAAYVDQQATLGDRLPIALGILAAATFAILFVMTGSVVLPLKALLMNLLSLSAAFGILVLIFQDGRLEGLLRYRSAGGLEATQPVLLFAMAFGLATDYGVFLLSRIKEARDSGLSDREAVAFGLERTGRIVTAAALLFCVAIGAFATSGVLFIKQVGLGTALAVAIDAAVVRALLVPSLMALLGRWNWWAPRPLRRLHERLGWHEEPLTA